MKTIALVAMLAAFLAAGLTPDRARADGLGKFFDNYHYGGRCDRWARISTSSATCLSSEDEGYLLDLSPSNTDSSGYAYWAKNECSDYGTIIAHNDIGGGIDHHWHLEDGEKIRITGSWDDSRAISCCIDKSDLCWKDQVEKNASNKVRVIILHSGSYDTGHVDVSTHEQRYNLCRDGSPYEDTIYCEEDPEGDAHVLPASLAGNMNYWSVEDLRARPCGGANQPTCSCDSRICDYFDCERNWNLNNLEREDFPKCNKFSHLRYEDYNEEAERCEFSVSCNTGKYRLASPSYYVPQSNWVDISEQSWNLRHLNLCKRPDGTLYLQKWYC